MLADEGRVYIIGRCFGTVDFTPRSFNEAQIQFDCQNN
jgi:hypothetical protein